MSDRHRWYLTHGQSSLPCVQLGLSEAGTANRTVYQGIEAGCCDMGLHYTATEARKIGQELIRLADELGKNGE